MSAEAAMGNGVMERIANIEADAKQAVKALEVGGMSGAFLCVVPLAEGIPWLARELRAALAREMGMAKEIQALRDEAEGAENWSDRCLEQQQRAEAAETALAAAHATYVEGKDGFQAVIAKWRNDYDTLSVRYTRAMEALRGIAARKGHCLLGPESTDAEELAFRTGSHEAFGQCAMEALSGIDKALASSGEGEK